MRHTGRLFIVSWIFILLFSMMIGGSGDGGNGNGNGGGDGETGIDNGNDGGGEGGGIGDDHGETPATATLVDPNSTTLGNLEGVGDVDVFRIDLPSDGTLTVSTMGTTDTVGTLLDASEEFLGKDDDSGDVPNFEISQTLSAGTYFVVVEGFSRSTTGSYTFVSIFVPSE